MVDCRGRVISVKLAYKDARPHLPAQPLLLTVIYVLLDLRPLAAGKLHTSFRLN